MKTLAVAAVLAVLLTGCGSDDPEVASDAGTSPATADPTPTPTPTEIPSDGPYPDFEPTDYTFVLATSCFCPDAGTPIAITVVDDEVTTAVLARDGTGRGGGKKGDPAADYLWRTIDDIIDEVNAAKAGGAAVVRLTWSVGEPYPYPTDVFIDQDSNMADEEVGYTISDVVVS
jgi:hypothetical protein